MKIVKDPDRFQKEMERLRDSGQTIGFVPTMGALHEGHLSLIRASKCENQITAVSLFVNPLQFGPQEDFSRYPRMIYKDSRKLRALKVDYLFNPLPRAMYPYGFVTMVVPGMNAQKARQKLALIHNLCGRYRPGHFEGVATIVAKLLLLSKCHRTYFGAKDYQQAMVVRRLIEDLNLGIRLRILPTVREPDGLALSSRNRYLESDDRKRAAGIFQTLVGFKNQLQKGGISLSSAKKKARQKIKSYVDRVEYLDIVDPDSLESLKRPQRKMVAATACWIKKTRLIDNATIELKRG